MPVTARDGALLGAGMTLVAASTFFYRRKQTLPFKVAYFLSWPVLGTAVILAWQPSPGEMSHMVKDSGIANESQLHEVRAYCLWLPVLCRDAGGTIPGADAAGQPAPYSGAGQDGARLEWDWQLTVRQLAMETAADALQEWQLDPDRSLILSDVHVGCGQRSKTADVQTTVLNFRWHSGQVNSVDERRTVLLRPDSKQHRAADGHTATTIRDELPSNSEAPHSAAKIDHADDSHPVSTDITAYDADGDLVLARRPRAIVAPGAVFSLAICHRMATPLRSVGLQVWRGSLLLAEYVLSRAASFAGVTGCELGAGTGVASIALACAGARRVFVTDVGDSVLDMCQANVTAHEGLFPCGPSAAVVRALDWFDPPSIACGRVPERAQQASGATDPFAWLEAELHDLQHAEVILAADTVYDEQLTEALMRCATQLLRPCATCGDAARGTPAGRNMLLVLEKRFNFTLKDLDTRATADEHWRSLFAAGALVAGSGKDTAVAGCDLSLRGRQIPLDAIPRLLDYDRGPDLELWVLSSP